MDVIGQIIASFRDRIPANSQTAAAIDRGAAAEEISACATAEGLHALAGALFEACEVGASDGLPDTDAKTLGSIRARLDELRQDLPAGSDTARLIDARAPLEEISEAATLEGLHSLAALLVESEQEQDRSQP